MVDFLYNGKNLTAILSGEIDHHSASYMRKKIDLEIKEHLPERVSLDFKKVTFMDSSGIGLIIGRQHLISQIGGKIEISNASSQIKKILSLSGIDRIADII